MIEFQTLTFTNFLSYGAVPTVIELNKPGTTLILGKDLDNTSEGVGANGVGKTVVLNALVYACYDKAISDIQKDNLVNNINKKKMQVSVVFVADGVTYTINRFRKMKAGAAGNYVQLFEGDKNITPSSLAETNKLIENIIGMPYDIFVRVVTFSATLTPFLALPVHSPYAANQTDIVEELVDLKVLSEKANYLKEDIKDTKLSLKTQMTTIDLQTAEVERHKKQVKSAELRVINWDKDNKRDIKNIKAKLKRVEKVDIAEQQKLNLELEEHDASIKKSKTERRALVATVSTLTTKIDSLKKELSHLDDEKCTYCLQKFANADETISGCKTELEESENHLVDADAAIGRIDHDLNITNTLYDACAEGITVSNVDELLEIKSKASVYQAKIAEMQVADNPYLEPLDELNAADVDDINMDKVNELTKTVEHQQFLLKLLTKKDSFVRKTLLNKSIPFLNARLSHYLDDLGLPHTVEFTHEMTANISQFGRPMDFGNLSSGQRARVNLALSFAFRDVLQNRTSRVNVCLLDEVLDVGLDSVGITNAARMIKRKSRDEGLSMYIISHRGEVDSAFDNRVMVQMEKGFSSIQNEDNFKCKFSNPEGDKDATR